MRSVDELIKLKLNTLNIPQEEILDGDNGNMTDESSHSGESGDSDGNSGGSSYSGDSSGTDGSTMDTPSSEDDDGDDETSDSGDISETDDSVCDKTSESYEISDTDDSVHVDKIDWKHEYNGGKKVLDLNDDVMFEILKNVTNVRELLRLKLVCKRFEAVVTKYVDFRPTKICEPRHLYYASEFRDSFNPRVHKLEINLAQLLSNFKRLSHLNALVFSNYVWWDLFSLEGSLPCLVNLEVRSTHPTLSNETLAELLRRCFNLEKLLIWNFSRYNLDFTCLSDKLTTVEFKNHGSTKAILNFLKEKGSQLKSLWMQSDPYDQNRQTRILEISEKSFASIIDYCPNLTSLKIVNYNISGNLRCLLQLHGLEKLVIASVVDFRFSSNEYIKILKNNPSLTHLTIPVPNNEFLDFFKTCAIHNPKLQYLDSLYNHMRFYSFETKHAINAIWSKFDNLCELNKWSREKFNTAQSNLLEFSDFSDLSD